MAFWFAFLWWLGTSIASALLAKPKIENARPSGLDDFQVPTATEGRVVPIIVGKVQIKGPNVVWYGDLTTTAITEKVGGFFGIGAKSVTKAYEYRIGVQMGICRGPIDGFDRIWLGDKIVKTGETGAANISIVDLEFFGGENSGGGVDFSLEVHLGAADQAVSAYLATQQDPVPNYQNTCYLVLNDGAGGPGYIGNTAQLRQLAFEPFWYPNSLAVTGGKERIGDDANPICFLFELLVTNDDWGISFNASDTLITGTAAEGALRALAEQVADEGLGFSMVIDRSMQARELILEIERHVDGAFRLDLTDGKYKLILARAETPTITLDESNIKELVNFARGNWAETRNELRIGYADRDKEYASTYALDQDRGNLDITGERAISSMNFPGVKTAAVANIIVARELATLSFPLSKLSVLVDRSLYAIQRGTAFKWTWPDEGITDLPFRVIKVSYGSDREKEIRLDAVENVFLLETTGFADPPATGWIAPDATPQPALDERLWQIPLTLSEDGANRVATLLVRDGGLHVGYEIFTDLAGGTAYVQANTTDDFTPTAQLNASMSNSVAIIAAVVIKTAIDLTIAQLTEWGSTTFNAAVPDNLFLINDELMWFETVTDNLDGTFDLENVHRAELDTQISAHSADARIWFPTHGAGLVIPEAVDAPPQTISAKLLPRTAIGTLAIGSAAQLLITTEDFIGYGFDYGNNYGSEV